MCDTLISIARVKNSNTRLTSVATYSAAPLYYPMPAYVASLLQCHTHVATLGYIISRTTLTLLRYNNGPIVAEGGEEGCGSGELRATR